LNSQSFITLTFTKDLKKFIKNINYKGKEEKNEKKL